MLAAGTFAQTTYSAIPYGVAVLAPLLRREFGLSLAETGLPAAHLGIDSPR